MIKFCQNWSKFKYTPPFEITSKIIELISNISEKIGEINSNSKKEVISCIERLADSLFKEMNNSGIEIQNVIIGKKRTNLKTPNRLFTCVKKVGENLIQCPFVSPVSNKPTYSDIAEHGQYYIYRYGKKMIKEEKKDLDGDENIPNLYV